MRNTRGRCASHHTAFAQPILGQLRSIQIKCHFGFKFQRNTFQNKFLARSADGGSWLSLPHTSTRQGQPIGSDLTYGQMPTPLIGVAMKPDIRVQTLRAVTVRGALLRASARCAIGKMEMQDAREISRRSALHSSGPVPNGHICSSLKWFRLNHVCTRDLFFIY